MAHDTERLGRLKLRDTHPDDLPDWTPLPLYHHPIVAISAILIIASISQIGAWLIRLRLVNNPPMVSSSATVHGWLYEKLLETVFPAISGPAYPMVVFLSLLGLGLISCIAWYVAIRLAYGPAWGLAAALCWAAHPAFALTVQKPTSLILVLFMVSAVLALLFWWKSSQLRILIAPLVGVALSLASLLATIGACCVPLVFLSMCLAGKAVRYRFISAVLCLATYALFIVPWWSVHLTQTQRTQMQSKIRFDFWTAVANGESTPLAEAADTWLAGRPEAQLPSPWLFLYEYGHSSPLETARWLTSRLIRTVYATDDGRFQRPQLVLQMVWFIPALWGCVVAIRHGPWRWAALTGLGAILIAWLIAAITEPLARNLAPIGGMGVTFALIGIADVYERMFGRRLTQDADSRSDSDHYRQ